MYLFVVVIFVFLCRGCFLYLGSIPIRCHSWLNKLECEPKSLAHLSGRDPVYRPGPVIPTGTRYTLALPSTGIGLRSFIAWDRFLSVAAEGVCLGCKGRRLRVRVYIYIYLYLGIRHVPEFCLGAFVYPQSSYRAVLGRLKNDPHPHRPRPRGGPEPGGKLCVCVSGFLYLIS